MRAYSRFLPVGGKYTNMNDYKASCNSNQPELDYNIGQANNFYFFDFFFNGCFCFTFVFLYSTSGSAAMYNSGSLSSSIR